MIVTATAAAVRRAGADHQRPPDARQQHADPELVGRRRQLLVHTDPKLSNYYYVTFASAFGDDPVRAVNALRKQEQGRDREGREHGSVRDRLAAIDGINLALKRTGGIDERHPARRADVAVQERPDPVGARERSRRAVHTVFGRRTGSFACRTTPRGSSARSRPRSSRRSEGWRSLEPRWTTRGGPERALRAASVSRAFAGRARPPGVTVELPPARGGRAHRPERRRQVDARERPDGLRLPGRGVGRARGAGHHALESAPARARRACAHVPAQPLVPGALRPRERRGRGPRRGRVAARARSAAPTSLLESLHLDAYAERARRARSPHGDERRLGVARALATEPRSCSWTSLRPASRRRRCRTFAA